MSIDDIKQPIIAETIVQREAELLRRIFYMKLMHLETEKPRISSSPKIYFETISQFSEIRMIFNLYEKKIRKDSPDISQSELDDSLAEIKTEIDSELMSIVENFSDDERREKISDFLKKYLDLFPEAAESSKEMEQIGPIQFECVKGTEFESFKGIKKDEDVLEIHFEALFRNESKTFPADVRGWLSKIAEYIVDKKPQIVAVVGHSWLMSHPIAERLGFDVRLAKEDSLSNASWHQLIREDGEIDFDRVEYYIKNGKLPYPVSVGIIPIEDFLKMYLPENRFGEITLKKIDLEYEQKRLKILSEALQFQSIQFLNGGITAEDLLKSCPSLEEYLNSVGLRDAFIELAKERAKMRTTVLTEDNSPAVKDLFNRFGEAISSAQNNLNNSKYTEYTLEIKERKTQAQALRESGIRKAREKFLRHGPFALTAKENAYIGNVSDDRLVINPGKALWEVMTEDEIQDILDRAMELSNDPNVSDEVSLDNFDFFNKSIFFLHSVGRLPKKYPFKSF